MSNKEIDILKHALEQERTARKQAEIILEQKTLELYKLNEQLRRSNSSLENLNKKQTSQLDGVFTSLVDAYVLMDLEGNIQKMNVSANNLLGYNQEDELNIIHLIHKDDYKQAIRVYVNLIEDGFLKDYKTRVYTKTKQIKKVYINASLIYDGLGKPIGVQSIIRDVTEEVERRAIFERQKQQLSIIVENSPIGIALTQDGFFLEINKAFKDLLGYSDKELKRLSIKEISFAEDFLASANYLKQLQKGEINRFSVTKRYLCKDQSVVWAKTSVGSVRNINNEIEYQVALIEDVTEERAEIEVKKQLLKDLGKSNEELNDYAHVISHDLKSPLRSMSTLIYWFQEDYNEMLDVNAKDILNKLTLKVNKMEALINGVLDYSSIDKVPQSFENVNAQQLVTDIVKIIFIPKHVKINIPVALPIIFIGRFRLQQLFQNLINNAVSYIDKEKGLVNIEYSETPTHWQFSVNDNGIGIEDKYQNKIFEVFQSLEKSEHSTGIGLSIVKKIVNYYEGKIWLTSKPGEGSTFYFTLKKYKSK